MLFPPFFLAVAMSRVIRMDFVNNDFFFDDHRLFVVGSPNCSPDPTTDSAADDCTFLATNFRTDSGTGSAANCTADDGTRVQCQR